MKISLINLFGKEGPPLINNTRIRIVQLERTVLNSSFKFNSIRRAWSFWIRPLSAKNFKFEIEVKGTKIVGLTAILFLYRSNKYIRNDKEVLGDADKDCFMKLGTSDDLEILLEEHGV